MRRGDIDTGVALLVSFIGAVAIFGGSLMPGLDPILAFGVAIVICGFALVRKNL